MSSPPADSLSFLERIRALLEQLPPAERRLGDFILDFPGELASYSASELAALVQVSNASVSRFVQRLGYANYEEARRHARDQRSAGSPLFLTPAARSAGGAGDAAAGSIAAHLQRAQDNLVASCAALDEAMLDDIVRALVAARGVFFLGLRNNRNFAAYLRWQLAQLLPRTQVIPGPGESLGEYAVDLGQGDMLVVFALRRSPTLALAFAERAALAGASVLCIADPATAAPGTLRWVLRCPTTAPGPLDSHVAVMLLCELLATRALARAGAGGRARLAGVEAAHTALGELREGGPASG